MQAKLIQALALTVALLTQSGVAAEDTVGRHALAVTSRPVYLLCNQLSREHHVAIVPEGADCNLLVNWYNRGPRTLQADLDCLAQLTGAQVFHESPPTGEKYYLRKDLQTLGREAAWNEMLLARVCWGIDPRFSLIRAGPGREGAAFALIAKRLLAKATREDLRALLHDRAVRFPLEAISEDQKEQFVQSIIDLMPSEVYPKGFDREKLHDSVRNSIDKDGIAFEYKWSPGLSDDKSYLTLTMDNAVLRSMVIGSVPPDDVPIPLVHRNPHQILKTNWVERQLTSDVAVPLPQQPVPESFQQPIGQEVVLPVASPPGAAFAKLAEASKLEVICDDYLGRRVSRASQNELPLRLPADMSRTSALDAVCHRTGYVWWESKGIVYCRSSTFVQDFGREVPAQLIDRIRRELRAGGIISQNTLEQLARLTWSQSKSLARMGSEIVSGSRCESLLDENVQSFLKFMAQLEPVRLAAFYRDGLIPSLQDVPRCRLLRRYEPDKEQIVISMSQALEIDLRKSGDDAWCLSLVLSVKSSKHHYPDKYSFVVAIPPLWSRE